MRNRMKARAINDLNSFSYLKILSNFTCLKREVLNITRSLNPSLDFIRLPIVMAPLANSLSQKNVNLPSLD